jgi:hypothetical protein
MKEQPELRFDEDTHTYMVKDREVPSVTTIIEDVIRYQEKFEKLVSDGVMSKPDLSVYAAFGSAVHKACELHIKGNLDMDNLDPDLKAPLDAFVKFIDDTKFELIESEQRRYSEEYWFAGTYDLYGVLRGKKTIIDIKTGREGKQHHLQTAAYAILRDEQADRYCLYLDRDEPKYKLKKHKRTNDVDFWKNVMIVYHGKERYK